MVNSLSVSLDMCAAVFRRLIKTRVHNALCTVRRGLHEFVRRASVLYNSAKQYKTNKWKIGPNWG